jgi:hypothetical protein
MGHDGYFVFKTANRIAVSIRIKRARKKSPVMIAWINTASEKKPIAVIKLGWIPIFLIVRVIL